jgi:hypothetical protein
MLLLGKKKFGQKWIFFGIQSKPDFKDLKEPIDDDFLLL